MKKHGNAVNGRTRRRGNGSGTIFLKGGKFFAKFSVRDELTGKLKRVSRATGASTLEEARDALERMSQEFATKGAIVKEGVTVTRKQAAERDSFARRIQDARNATAHVLAELEAERKMAADRLPATTIEDGWDLYVKSPNRHDTGEATMGVYEGQYEIFAKWAAEHRPDVVEMRRVDDAVAGDFMRWLVDTGRGPNTYNKYVTLLRYVWKVLELPARLTSNPWNRIEKKKIVEHSRRDLTHEELTAILSSLTGEMRTLFYLGTYTGKRLKDCALMRWEEIDLAHGVIAKEDFKTMRYSRGRVKIVPVHPALKAELEKTPKAKRVGHLCPTLAEEYNRDRAALVNLTQAVFRNVGIATSEKGADGKMHVVVGFHSLRHTFASTCLNSGVPLAFVQSMVGHSNPAMTRHYFHENVDAMAAAVGKLPAYADA